MKKLLLLILLFLGHTFHLSAQYNTCPLAAASPLSIPYTATNVSNCGAGNDFDNGTYCTAGSTKMEELFYSFVATSPSIKITLSNIKYAGAKANIYNIYIGLFSACPPASGCMLVGKNDTARSEIRLFAQDTLVVGKQYYMVIDASGFTSPMCFGYDLKIENMDWSPDYTQEPCTNMDFEVGAFTGWTGWTGGNKASGFGNAWEYTWLGVPKSIPDGGTWKQGIVSNGVNSVSTSPLARHTIMTGAGVDPYGLFPVVPAGAGNFSARVGNAVNGAGMERIAHKFIVDPGNAFFDFQYAVVLENPGHTPKKLNNYFDVSIYGPLGESIGCFKFTEFGDFQPNAPTSGFIRSTVNNSVFYKPWTRVSVNLSPYMGKEVTIVATSADCAIAGHWGYGYLDAKCNTGYKFKSKHYLCSAGDSATLVAPPSFLAYEWSPGGATTQKITVKTGGIYSVKLSSQYCSGSSINDTVIDLTGITAAFSGSYNCDTRTASFTDNTIAPAGVSPTYLWTFGDGQTSTQKNPTHTYPSNGPFTVKLDISFDSCTFPATKTINFNNCFTTRLTKDTICVNGCTNLTASTTGGVAPLTYTWTPSLGTGTGPYNVCLSSTATYKVTAKDANGYYSSDSSVILVTSPPALTTTVQNVKCYGGNTGTATVTTTGGNPPFTYLWSNGQTTTTATGLIQGTYTVTVSDKSGCNATATASVNQPTAIQGTMTSTPVDCKGGNNGTAGISPSGGTPGYTYSWTPGILPTTQNITGLSAGTYTVAVTDANGCTKNFTATVAEPTLLTASTIISTPLTCYADSNAIVTINTSGGNAGTLKYQWTPGVSTTSTAGNLKADTYSITVTDTKGCTANTTAVITNPPQLTIATSAVTANCGKNDGSATVTGVTNGTVPYQYTWLPGSSTTQTITGLAAGTYTVIVKDAKNCVNNTTVNVNNQNAPTVTLVSKTDLLCNGASTGAITISASGSNPIATITWSPTTPVQTGLTVTGIKAGDYTATVIDDKGCQSSITTTITEPSPVVIGTSSSNVICKGEANGKVTATVGGGTPTYQYLWSPGSGTTANLSNLTGGTYTLTVTDGNNCIKTSTVTVNEAADSLKASFVNTKAVSCKGSKDGIITGTVTGGLAPYTYSWNPPVSTSSSVTGLSGGTYSIVVKDSYGCQEVQTVKVEESTQDLSLADSVKNASCVGVDNGFVNLFPDGGTGPYTYLWVPNGSTTQNITGLAGGTYSVVVTDKYGCSITKPYTVTQSSDVIADFEFTPAFGPRPLEVTFTNTSSGSTKYLWTFGTGDSSHVITPPAYTYDDIGTYTITLVAENDYGCSDTVRYTVRVDSKMVICIPNIYSPNGDGVNDVFKPCPNQEGIKELEGEIYDRWGLLLFSWNTVNGGWDGRTTAGQQVPDGTYYYIIKVKGYASNDWVTAKGFILLVTGK